MHAGDLVLRDEQGFVTVQVITAVAFSLVLFALLTNVIVFAYGRGVVRAALDEGVRAASAAGGEPAQCVARASAVLGDLLGGQMGGGVGPISCSPVDGEPPMMTAVASTTFEAWFPGVPAYTFTTRAAAVLEVEP
jgi:hypothetical protein